MKNISLVLISFFLVGLFTSCSKSASKTFTEGDANSLEVNGEKTLSLRDYLVRFPNLYWTGNKIMLRETASITAQNEPLYIIDGVKIGNDYGSASSFIDPNDIKNVKVLTNASETSIYGIAGSSGVIIIKSKK